MASTIDLLEDAAKEMLPMSADEAKSFHLDSCLGGSSEVHVRKSVERYVILLLLRELYTVVTDIALDS